jgi:SAM-dependent methyltransferase
MKQWDYLAPTEVLDNQVRSWWFQGKQRIFDALFAGRIPPQARVLDVGAGQGLFVNHLAGPGRLVAVDEWPASLIRNRERGGLPVGADALHLPFRDGQFDYLFALDVLEHLPDDYAAVKEWARMLKPGGQLILNIPAMEWLWSEHDVRMGHYRRYTKAKLRRVLESNGLVCERMVYSNFFLVPFAWLSFRLKLHQGSDANPEAHMDVPKPISAVIMTCYQIEAAWLKHCSFPFGGSLVSVARKPQGK